MTASNNEQKPGITILSTGKTLMSEAGLEVVLPLPYIWVSKLLIADLFLFSQYRDNTMFLYIFIFADLNIFYSIYKIKAQSVFK